MPARPVPELDVRQRPGPHVALVGAAAVIVAAVRTRQAERRAQLAARAARAQAQATAAVFRTREAAEINDTIIQGVVVAKWSLEAGRHEYSHKVLTETIRTAQELVSQLLSSHHPVEPGELRRREAAQRAQRG